MKRPPLSPTIQSDTTPVASWTHRRDILSFTGQNSSGGRDKSTDHVSGVRMPGIEVNVAAEGGHEDKIEML